MRKSLRIRLTYSCLAFVMLGCVAVLEYLAWTWQPMPLTMEVSIRPALLALLPLLGLAFLAQVFFDPLATRVVRLLRRRERLSAVATK